MNGGPCDSGGVEPSFEIFNFRVKIIMGAFVLIHGNGISGDVERIFELFNIRGETSMGPFVLIHRNGISGDFERSFEIFACPV